MSSSNNPKPDDDDLAEDYLAPDDDIVWDQVAPHASEVNLGSDGYVSITYDSREQHPMNLQQNLYASSTYNPPPPPGTITAYSSSSSTSEVNLGSDGSVSLTYDSREQYQANLQQSLYASSTYNPPPPLGTIAAYSSGSSTREPNVRIAGVSQNQGLGNQGVIPPTTLPHTGSGGPFPINPIIFDGTNYRPRTYLRQQRPPGSDSPRVYPRSLRETLYPTGTLPIESGQANKKRGGLSVHGDNPNKSRKRTAGMFQTTAGVSQLPADHYYLGPTTGYTQQQSLSGQLPPDFNSLCKVINECKESNNELRREFAEFQTTSRREFAEFQTTSRREFAEFQTTSRREFAEFRDQTNDTLTNVLNMLKSLVEDKNK